uniref:Uncharacterized protein n=1 Tax=Acidobacterium capsulatum TaxID=33075 RepID=A0A7V5CS43_9BACT
MATHSATPQEDIGSILERFQQWTGDQSRPAAANDPNAPFTGFQRSAHQAYTSTRQIARELSYEEALSRARSRTRRPWEDDESVEPAASATPPQPTATPTPAPQPAAKAAAASSSSKSRKPAKTAAEKPVMKTATPSTAARTRAQSQTRKTSATTQRKTKAAGSSKKAKSAAKAPATASAAKRPQAAASPSSAASRDVATPGAAYDLQPSPSFQQILAAQFKTGPLATSDTVTEVVAQPATVHAEEVSGTAVTVTVHLSVTERNALRTRAQQLGLTADAYLRQCALEVESLRSELQEVLVTRMQAARQLPAQPRRDWLGRLKQYFFPSRTDCQTQIFHA